MGYFFKGKRSNVFTRNERIMLSDDNYYQIKTQHKSSNFYKPKKYLIDLCIVYEQ